MSKTQDKVIDDLNQEKEKMSNQEAIDRWAKYIIPVVFKAEDALKKANPEWEARLRALGQPGGEDPHKVAEEYCREIATIIVRFGSDYDQRLLRPPAGG